MSRPTQNIPRRSQAERSATTIANLIEATIAALHEHGYAATSTSLVAKRAGVSRGAMLHHFPTKVQLMAATVYAAYDQNIDAYRQVLEVQGKLTERLDRLIDTAWTCFKSPSGIAETEIWMATRSDVNLAAAVLPVHAAIVAQSAANLEELIGDRIAGSGVTNTQILTYMVAALHGLALAHTLGTPQSDVDMAVSLIKKTVRSLVGLDAST